MQSIGKEALAELEEAFHWLPNHRFAKDLSTTSGQHGLLESSRHAPAPRTMDKA